MMRQPIASFASRWPLWLVVAFVCVVFPPRANAVCNVIPAATGDFRAALGQTDRPYSVPGDFVEITLRESVCDGASAGLADYNGDAAADGRDLVVTLVFEPPGGGPRNAVLVTADCAAAAFLSRVDACETALGGGTVTCVEAPPSDLFAAHDAGLDETLVRFRFPDTDARVGTASDDRTLTGPVTIAVSPSNAASFSCDLAQSECTSLVAGGRALVACVDQLFETDGTCETAAAHRHATFASFTALPPPNDSAAVCAAPSPPCTGTAAEVRVTTDVAGNVLLPFDYRGVLLRTEGIPVPRLVRGVTSLDAFAGAPFDPIQVPSVGFLSSYAPNRKRVPPIFTPLASPSGSGQPSSLFGSVDAPLGVIRVARQACVGGQRDGRACTANADCPGATCSAPIFELGDRYQDGVGPVLIAEASYDVATETPVPLDGLHQTISTPSSGPRRSRTRT
jgi:hypothetical protein